MACFRRGLAQQSPRIVTTAAPIEPVRCTRRGMTSILRVGEAMLATICSRRGPPPVRRSQSSRLSSVASRHVTPRSPRPLPPMFAALPALVTAPHPAERLVSRVSFVARLLRHSEYSARHGLRPRQFDITYAIINLFRRVGLVHSVKLPSEAAKRRLRIQPE